MRCFGDHVVFNYVGYANGNDLIVVDSLYALPLTLARAVTIHQDLVPFNIHAIQHSRHYTCSSEPRLSLSAVDNVIRYCTLLIDHCHCMDNAHTLLELGLSLRKCNALV